MVLWHTSCLSKINSTNPIGVGFELKAHLPLSLHLAKIQTLVVLFVFAESLALSYVCGSYSIQQLIRIHRITLKGKKQNKQNEQTHEHTDIQLHTCSNKLLTLPKWREWILYQLKWNCKTLHWTSVDWAVSNQLMAFNFTYFKDCCNYDGKKRLFISFDSNINRSVSLEMDFFLFDFVYWKIK